MNAIDVSRRKFLVGAGAAAGGLTLGMSIPFDEAVAQTGATPEVNAWVVIRPDDGVVIRINIPALTEQRRKEYVKIVKNMSEDGRIAVRNVRRDARKHLEAAEKASEISADQLERAEKELDKLTHDTIDHIDKALARKEQELLEV